MGIMIVAASLILLGMLIVKTNRQRVRDDYKNALRMHEKISKQ